MAKRQPRRPTQKKQNLGEIRIIGGDFRGRKLPVLDQPGLRPTSDRVKETLFNWLQFEIPGASCLDLFAGSGSLSFEALSRGASHVTLLELNAQNAQVLQQNIDKLKLGNANLIQADSLQWLSQPVQNAFNVVFIDPPFHQELLQKTVDLLFANGFVDSDSLLYLEQENTLNWPNLPDGWELYREKQTSQVKYALCRFFAEEPTH